MTEVIGEDEDDLASGSVVEDDILEGDEWVPTRNRIVHFFRETPEKVRFG